MKTSEETKAQYLAIAHQLVEDLQQELGRAYKVSLDGDYLKKLVFEPWKLSKKIVFQVKHGKTTLTATTTPYGSLLNDHAYRLAIVIRKAIGINEKPLQQLL